MKNFILISLVTSILFSCSSTNSDLDELRQEVEQLKIDNENLANEVGQNNLNQESNSYNYNVESKKPIIYNQEKDLVESKIETNEKFKNMTTKEVLKSIGEKIISDAEDWKAKDEVARIIRH
jgi:hypothetical protein